MDISHSNWKGYELNTREICLYIFISCLNRLWAHQKQHSFERKPEWWIKTVKANHGGCMHWYETTVNKMSSCGMIDVMKTKNKRIKKVSRTKRGRRAKTKQTIDGGTNISMISLTLTMWLRSFSGMVRESIFINAGN